MATPTPRAIGRYTAEQVARLAGVSSRRIAAWARQGIVPASGAPPYEYTYAAAGEAVLAHYLITTGLRSRDIRRVVEGLRDRYGTWPLSSAPLGHDGALVVVRDAEGLHFTAAGEQQVLSGTLLDLRRLRDALRHGGWAAMNAPRPLIRVDPNRHSGAPTLVGHRLSTALVAQIADEEDGAATLRDGYGLSEEEIAAAIEYEHAVEEALAS